ncbi:MAG: SUMF1/EgtB/PvdO family nonheme iron enzyme [Akkermansiaceae bacterium]|nr:SUMF1/EgtB/PvdO family nonheme iron enzyme [Akkermansiaceae bacterium]
MKTTIAAAVAISVFTLALFPATLSAKKNRDKGGQELSFGTKESLRLAIQDLIDTHGAAYPKGPAYLEKLASIENEEQMAALRKEALMANPAIDFEKLIIVERSGSSKWLPANWQCNSSIPKKGHTNRIATLSLADGSIETVFQPTDKAFVGDLEVHYDAGKIMYSSISQSGAWGIFEMDLKTKTPRLVTPEIHDVDHMDACYLPDERILFTSTAGFQGVPCVGGSDSVANLHILDPKTNKIRRLCFDQENNWCPTVLPNGKILYLRWEYTDSAHYFSRVLMHMNPDGTNQKEFYGSNSYWPNSMFYARPVPGSANKFITIVTGHHGVARAGELILFDNNKGRHEADGVIQRIPGAGKKVEPVIKDQLVNGSFPLFLHPYPLSDKHFIVSMSLDKRNFGIYLVDTFDNIVPIKVVNNHSLVEAIPIRKTTRPHSKPDLVRLGEKDATFYIQNIYAGPGLAGVPKGTVKGIKVYKYEYAPRKQGGHYAIGMEGPWDVRTVLGTVPVNEDGSVIFNAPANTPIAFAPIDAEGKSLQMMRSWTTAMPGEVVSCVGCHEPQSMSPVGQATMASQMAPKKLTPWLGGQVRGFSFNREIQPVLDQHCVGCHTTELAKKDKRPDFQDMNKSYSELHPYVRRNGPEGDYHLLTPLEFHADTSELVQLLDKGHYNVKLDAVSQEKLITWIDMNVPLHGTWTEAPKGKDSNTEYFLTRRAELRRAYADLDINPEKILNPYTKRVAYVPPAPVKEQNTVAETSPHWPIPATKAERMQRGKKPIEVDLGNGTTMKFVYIPQGEFINEEGKKMVIPKAYWMSSTEVSLKQYRAFVPDYKNGVYDMHYKDQVDRGYYMNDPDFPVIRVSWDGSQDFCNWLSAKVKRKVSLPSEHQWEWACRAGSSYPLNYGNLDADFSTHANLSDVNMKKMAVRGVNPQPIKNPPPSLDFIPKVDTVDDGVLHLAKVGSYQPNIWGLHDMHGNVAEWTASDYAPGKKVIRGGSWRDRPFRAAAGYRLGFPAWQKVYNVGFRVIVEE